MTVREERIWCRETLRHFSVVSSHGTWGLLRVPNNFFAKLICKDKFLITSSYKTTLPISKRMQGPKVSVKGGKDHAGICGVTRWHQQRCWHLRWSRTGPARAVPDGWKLPMGKSRWYLQKRENDKCVLIAQCTPWIYFLLMERLIYSGNINKNDIPFEG